MNQRPWQPPAAASQDSEGRAKGLSDQAQLHLESGDRMGAFDLCRAALALDGHCFPAHRLLAKIGLSGEDYRDLIQRIHREFEPRAYLEIGVALGSTIVLAGENTLAIGVDPSPEIARPLPPNVRIVRETSDAFFAGHDLKQEFGGRELDLAFIDGMHRFEYALRDFMHIERNGTPATRVLMHDCYPLDEVTATRERNTVFWTGDVWKLTLCLKKYRPDLQVHTLAAPPSGLGVIRGLDPGSTTLAANFDAICREFVALPYAALQPDKRTALNLVAGDWETARGLLV